jgi:hypothetical protein
MKKKTFLFIFGFMLIFAAQAYADTWFVRDDVSRGSGRSWTSAWSLEELEKHWASIKPGDSVCFAYDDIFGTLNIKVSGSRKKPVHFIGAVYDTSSSKPFFGRGYKYGIKIQDCNYLTLENLKTGNTQNNGFSFGGNSTGITVNNCDAVNSSSGIDGFHLEGSSSVTFNNITASGWSNGSQADGFSQHPGTTATINNATFHDCSNGISNTDATALVANTITIYNCRKGYGVRMVNSVDGTGAITINGATIYDCYSGIALAAKGATVTINNADIYSSLTGACGIYAAGGTITLNKCYLHDIGSASGHDPSYVIRQQTSDNSVILNWCFLDGSNTNGDIVSIGQGAFKASYSVFTAAAAGANDYAIDLANKRGNRVILLNCVIANCRNKGLLTLGTDSVEAVRNCIFYNNTKLDWRADAGSIEDHNCFYGSRMSVQGKTADATDLNGTDDPGFEDPNNNFFWLSPDSPCIDRGAALGSGKNNGLSWESAWPDTVVIADQDAAGSGWEMGAYVYP